MDETIFKRSPKANKSGMEKSGKLKLTWKGKKIAMRKIIKIGRDKKNHIKLDDPLASRFHAVIERIGGVYYIRDLDSTNSTYVDKNPVKPGEARKLQPGSVINIGKCEFQVI